MRTSIESVRLTLTEDCDPDLSWLEDADKYEGCSPEEVATYLEQDASRLADYGNGWTSVGVHAVASIRFSEGSSVWTVGNEVSTAGLWGVESDSGSYFDEVGEQELSELRDMLTALGFSPSAIDEAFANVATDW